MYHVLKEMMSATGFKPENMEGAQWTFADSAESRSFFYYTGTKLEDFVGEYRQSIGVDFKVLETLNNYALTKGLPAILTYDREESTGETDVLTSWDKEPAETGTSGAGEGLKAGTSAKSADGSKEDEEDEDDEMDDELLEPDEAE